MIEYETYRTKEDAYLLIIIRQPQRDLNLVFLIDLWKVGIRDFETHKGSLRQLKNKLGIPSIKLHNIEKKDAAKLIRNGWEISNHLNIDIPPKARKWLEKLGINKLEYSGTVYKCFNCEEGDLTKEEVEEITEIALKEIEADTVGTEEEEQFFFICEKCKDEMHQQHSS